MDGKKTWEEYASTFKDSKRFARMLEYDPEMDLPEPSASTLDIRLLKTRLIRNKMGKTDCYYLVGVTEWDFDSFLKGIKPR